METVVEMATAKAVETVVAMVVAMATAKAVAMAAAKAGEVVVEMVVAGSELGAPWRECACAQRACSRDAGTGSRRLPRA